MRSTQTGITWGTDVPGFRDTRTFTAMWHAASFSERALVLGAPALLVLAVVVGA